MKISVVIPVYNAERNLRDSLTSVLRQSYQNWECICVDDGSRDESGRILDEFAARDSRFRVLHKTNGGEGSARNAATVLLSGDYVTYLDSDDCLHPEALQTIVRIQAKTSFDLLRFKLRNVSAHGGSFACVQDPVPFEDVDYHTCGESPFAFCGLGCATAISVSIARQVRWSDVQVGADLIFVMDCLLLAQRTVRTTVELVDYLVNPSSVSHRIWVGLLAGTCEYLPIMLMKSDEFGITPQMMRMAVNHVREIFFRRLLKSWRLLRDAGECESARQAFWTGVRRLWARGDVFTPCESIWVRWAIAGERALLFEVLVVWPYRLRRHMGMIMK